MLGIVFITIITTFFISLPASDSLRRVKEIIEASLFIILILLPLPIILNKYIDNPNRNGLKRFLSKSESVLKDIRIPLGGLFIALRILHVRINPIFEPVSWNMETITSVLLFVLLVPIIIYGILRKSNPKKYLKIHRFFIVLTYLLFIAHLFH